ncbi:hypothetical protein JZ751_006127, partial [Albula glossodonta]
LPNQAICKAGHHDQWWSSPHQSQSTKWHPSSLQGSTPASRMVLDGSPGPDQAQTCKGEHLAGSGVEGKAPPAARQSSSPSKSGGQASTSFQVPSLFQEGRETGPCHIWGIAWFLHFAFFRPLDGILYLVLCKTMENAGPYKTPIRRRLRAANQTTIPQHLKTPIRRRLRAANQTTIPQHLKPNTNTSTTSSTSVYVKEATTGQIDERMEIDEGMDVHNFGENTYTMEMSKMNNLLELSKSVCQVCINGSPCATGLHLFHKHILTNGHVVRDILRGDTWQLSQPVTVAFEELSQVCRQIPVEENVTAYKQGFDASNQPLDYALLQLVDSENLPPTLLPPALLSKCGHPKQQGRIYIIGHPGKDRKKMCATSIIEHDKRPMAFDKHFTEKPRHLAAIVGSLLKEKWDFKLMDNPSLITYMTNFLHGSSGSPVFQENSQLVSLHTGGYSYVADGQSFSITEYAISVMSILYDFLHWLLGNRGMQTHRKLDCLRAFSSEALKGSSDILHMMALFITEVLMRLQENPVYPKALQVLLSAVQATKKTVKVQVCKALRMEMDKKPSLKGISKAGLFNLANTEEEKSSIDTLGRFLFESQRGVLADVRRNFQGVHKQKKKTRGMKNCTVGEKGIRF